ncbi:hypothetical protein NQ317_011008 [Molorchus minor]|uniref:THAP-type domain-containing protein n=1 Tax=Molorchus minor TaxID=1323400 RepID=A0ABQ9IR86_9CUCU|nr:hypothetical protein NQ317_011008 [Molorchus minor]
MVSCSLCNLSHNARKVVMCISMFSKKPEVRSAWIKFLNRSEESLPKLAFLCSQHFQESDLDTSAFIVILKHNAGPSIYVARHKYGRITKSQKASSEPDSAVFTDGLPTTVYTNRMHFT